MTNEYIAGLIDGDGCFTLQITERKWKDGKKGIGLNPRVQIGFKSCQLERVLLKNIQAHFNAGKIYITNKGKKNEDIRFWTSNVNDTIKVCEAILPYLRIKKEQAKKLLKASKLIREKKKLRLKEFTLKGSKFYTKEEYIELAKISVSMNTGTQVKRWRNAKGRNLDYYLNIIENMYNK